MASETRELAAKEKQEMATPAERTTPGPVFTPSVDIFETEKELTVLADMPGVKPDDLTIDLRENTLTLSGEVAPLDETGKTDLLREYETGRYYRQFSLSEIIDQSKIDARLSDGVLRLSLPKMEKAQPRKITVKAA